MFFLRCAFWLTIVYASMSWTRDELISSGRQVAGTVLTSTTTISPVLVEPVVTGLDALCHRRPARCVADAAKLTALIEAGDRSDEADVEQSTRGAPLPIPDPRRRAHASLLTNRP